MDKNIKEQIEFKISEIDKLFIEYDLIFEKIKIEKPDYVIHLAKEDIKIIGIRHGEKMYETLLTNEECAHAVDMGNFYRVPCDKRGLNYDKYFNQGDTERNKLTEFNSNNTQLLTVEQTKEKIILYLDNDTIIKIEEKL